MAARSHLGLLLAFALGLAAALDSAALYAGPADAAAGPSLVAGSVDDADTWVTASEAGATYALPGGTKIRLAPKAKLRFESVVRLKLGPPSSPTTRTQSLRVASGRLDIDVPSSGDAAARTAVLVSGPGRVSAITKAGRSTLRARGGEMLVAARQGEMLVAVGNTWRPLAGGLEKVFGGKEADPKAKSIIGNPTLDDGPSLYLSSTGAPLPTSVAWQPVAGAASYDFTVYRLEDASRVLVAHESVAEARSEIDLGPGEYEAEISAIDADGLEGGGQAKRTLRVVGLVLPKGVLAGSDGSVQIGRHERIGLLAAEGLELAFGRSGAFVPAPSEVGLARGAATSVRLRRPGGSDTLTLKLLPRTVRASIAIGPKGARWPDDRVSVTVRLVDASGRPIPKTFEVATQVLVNVDPVDVRWTRSGATLTAELPAPGGSGPWVVRVEVKDPFGESLARDFMEIAGAGGQS